MIISTMLCYVKAIYIYMLHAEHTITMDVQLADKM